VHEDRGARIIGAALFQGALDWEDFLRLLVQLDPTASAPHDLLRRLVQEGVLTEAVLASLESTHEGADASHPPERRTQPSGPPFSGSGGPSALDPTGASVQTLLSIPNWRHYRNLRFIGQGAMGRIFKGFDSSLRRMVALKFLRRAEDPELLARFMLEAQHQACVEHPNICQVYEVGEWHGQAYIAMQFIRGEALDMCHARLSQLEKVKIIEIVAEALHAAHRTDLIHRDVKPANIMVETVEGRDPKPYILDFGLARGLDGSGLTVEGLVVGTYHFMAPEQARGDLKGLTRLTDVYSLGATLYSILAGKPPFWECEGPECLARTIDEDPVPLRHLVADLPEDLDTIVMKCLEKDPQRRYDSALALAEDLRRFRESEPILARRPTLGYRIRKFATKNRTLVSVSGVALVAVLSFAILGLHAWGTARARARWAQRFGQEAERIESLVRYSHLMRPHDVRGEVTQARARMAALELEARRAGRIAADPADYALGRSYLALGEPERARELLDRAWKSDLRTPEVALALGRTYGQLFRIELDRARGLPIKELREARVREVERTLRDPALRLLRDGASAALEAPSYHEALLAFYGGRWDEAWNKAQAALAETSWVYEARHLQGQILLERARQVGDPQAAIARLREAAEVFQGVQALAPSEPRAYLDEVEAWKLMIARHLEMGTDPSGALAHCRPAVALARVLDPAGPEAPALLATSVGDACRFTKASSEARRALRGELDRLSREALGLGPDCREALLARSQALLVAASEAWDLAKSRGAILDQVLPLLLHGRDRFPEDPNFLLLLNDYYHKRMTHEMYGGSSPWSSFEGALAMAATLLERYPELSESHGRVARAWVERAEYERTHGLDPSDSAERALHYLRMAETKGLRRDWYLRHQGDALLIRGQYRVRTGGSGEEDLRAAITAFGAASSLNSNQDMALVSAAEAAVWIAEARLGVGADPGPALAEVRELLAKNPGARTDYYYRPLVEGWAALRAGRWKALQGKDPTPNWDTAERKLKASLSLRGYASTAAALAELATRRYLRAGRAPDHLEALRRVRQSLQLDPRNAEAHLWAAVVEDAAARRPGPLQATSQAQARLALDQVLSLDRNMERTARVLGLMK
jgi:eukaryotic-like serine/threonine-protein kinase